MNIERNKPNLIGLLAPGKDATDQITSDKLGGIEPRVVIPQDLTAVKAASDTPSGRFAKLGGIEICPAEKIEKTAKRRKTIDFSGLGGVEILSA